MTTIEQSLIIKIMKKTLILITALVGTFSVSAQSLQYVMQRSSINIASISEVQNFQTFLSGGQSFAGFEGAPKDVLLNVASPITKGHTAEHTQNFASATVRYESYGAHSIFQATAGYNYRLFIGERANLTFGLGAGVKNVSKDYGKWESAAFVHDEKETSFSMQLGAKFEMDKLSISAFTNDNDFFGEIVWGRLWNDGKSSNRNNNRKSFASLRAPSFREKNWHGQVAALGHYNTETKTRSTRISANLVYKDGLGVGMSYQTDKDLSANINLRVSKHLRIGYAHQLLHLNPIARKHEIAVRYRMVKD
jgi:hypothetical protein